MNKIFRLLRVEHQAAARRPWRVSTGRKRKRGSYSGCLWSCRSRAGRKGYRSGWKGCKSSAGRPVWG